MWTADNKISLADAQVPKPPLVLDAAHYARLSRLAVSGEASKDHVAAALSEEIARADIMPSNEIPQNVVNIGSFVTFRYNDTGWSEEIQLVLPEDANMSERRVSVFTPIGVALIGLTEGQQMSWHTRYGETRSLTVLVVRRGESRVRSPVPDAR
jgi:regulator of nucleoside diphosphate kinase